MELVLSHTFPTVLLLIIITSMGTLVEAKEPLYILGLYPFTGVWPTGDTIHSASAMAVTHINANQSVLPDYELVLITGDSACNLGIGVNALFRELYNASTTKLILIGPGCSNVAEPLAESIPYWNLLTISYSAESPVLAQRDKYPTFFRTCLSGVVANDLRLAFMQQFNWKKVAFINQRLDNFSLVLSEFRKKIVSKDIEIMASEIITDDPKQQLLYVKNLGARILFGSFHEPLARKVICSAAQIGMIGPKYVWLLPGWYQDKWWRTRNPDENLDCSADEMDEFIEGMFTSPYVDLAYTNRESADVYIDNLRAHTGVYDVQSAYGFGYGAYAYDTVWTAALVLDRTDKILTEQGRRISDFTYNNADMAELMFEVITNISFPGVTGPVQFTSSGERRGLVLLKQYQNGTNVEVGILNTGLPEGEQLRLYSNPAVKWKDGIPPVDSATEVEELQLISLSVFVVVVIFATFGIMMAIALAVFNFFHRNVRVIKMSSPRLNNMILLGGGLIYTSVIVGGIDFLSENMTLNICKVYTWLFVIGFSVSFGSLFMKTWRVHRIITTKSVIPKKISDVNLILKVFLLASINGFVLLSWELLDPVEIISEQEILSEDTAKDVTIISIYLYCRSTYYLYWMGALLRTNGILLIFGAFLSWETRHITIPSLNDSKQIGTSIYIVAVSAVIVLPLSIVVTTPNVLYLFQSVIILIATTFVLLLVFIPKVKARNDVGPIRTFTAPEQSVHVPNNNGSISANK